MAGENVIPCECCTFKVQVQKLRWNQNQTLTQERKVDFTVEEAKGAQSLHPFQQLGPNSSSSPMPTLTIQETFCYK